MNLGVARNKRARHGFTLVELLVVVVVLTIIVTITTVAYISVQADSRDSRRLADADNIVKAINLYQVRNGSYFAPVSGNGSWETSHEDNPGDFLTPLVEQDLMKEVPVDPTNSDTFYYAYYRYAAGAYGCDSSKGAFFVFGIRDLENSDLSSSKSPGWSCPGRDWSTEFDWVTGGFEGL